METRRVASKNPVMNALSRLKTIVLKNPIAQKAAGSFGIKVFSLGISFFTNVFLARALGASGYGDYIYAITWVGFLSVPACLGFPEYLVREVAIYNAKEEWGLLKGLLKRANQIVLLLSIVVGAIAAITASWTTRANPEVLIVFWLSLVSLPFTALTYVRQGSMRGLNQVVRCDFPELLIKPLLFLALVAVTIVLLPAYLNAYSVMGIYVFVVGVAAWVGSRQLYTAMPTEAKRISSSYQTEQWIRGSLPFLMIVAMFAINQQIDVLMLGAIQGTSAAGIYTVVGRGAQLIQFSLASVSSATGPTLAQLYAVQDLDRMERVTHNSARLLWCACAAISISLIAVGYWFLLIFGAEFVQGQTALRILCLGYMLSAPFELAGLLLLMTGRERDTAIGTGITAMLNVVLNSLLIPRFGLEGAAFATATSLVARAAFFSVRTYQTLRIVPNPLNFSEQSVDGTAIETPTTKSKAILRILKQLPFQLKWYRQLKRRYPDLSIDLSTLLNYQESQALRVGTRVRIGQFSELTAVTNGIQPGRITIAGSTTIGDQARLIAIGERIFIGQNCRLGDRVSLIASCSERDIPRSSDPSIYLGDAVQLGSDVIVQNGCAIGKNSIVRAGSVVTEDIPENEIWAGNPAKKVRDRKGLSHEDIATLLEAQ